MAALNCGICKMSLDDSVWCSATDVEYFTTTRSSYQYRECKACGTLRIDPVPLGQLDEIYPSNYYSYTPERSGKGIVYRIKAFLDTRMLRRITDSLPGTHLNALDVGGGTTTMLRSLMQANPRFTSFTLVDLDSRAGVDTAKSGISFFCGRIEDYEPTDKFDFIMMFNLIEHVDDPISILSKLANSLAPSGQIVVKTPNYRSLDAILFKDHSWTGLHCPRHWTLFCKESFELAAQQAGLQIKLFRYTQGAPFWAGSLLAMMAHRGWIQLDRQHPTPFHPLMNPLLAIFAGVDFVRIFLGFRSSQMYVVLGK